ncbi:MAG: alkene reductase, partial [Chitinophagaceae bacterium]|nr:alkene reductase [Chitinophagaceae bacterium]
MNSSVLFTPYQLAGMELSNKMVMAPMTRSRADNAGAVPNQLMATYYAQRASAGLIVTEGAPVSTSGVGYINVPGIYSEAQVAGWKLVTNAVHEKGGKIFIQ